MQHIITAAVQAADGLALDMRAVIDRHFSLSIGGSMTGLFIRVPFTRLSAWVEWGQPHAGFGFARPSQRDLEFFMGTVRGVFSVEPKIEGGAA